MTWCTTGSDRAAAALGAEAADAAAERADAPRRRAPSASWTRLIHWTSAPHDEHERRADRDDADLGAVPRHPLAEQQDHDERERRDQRDEPRVVEEEHRSASALQHVDVVEIGAVQVAVDEQHDREPDTDLGRGDREHEQREHLADRRCCGTRRTRRG